MTLEQRMENFVRLALDRGLRIEGIAAADEKTLLFHHHFTADQPRNIYSHTKSYMATAVGMAIADGALHLDDTLASFFPENAAGAPVGGTALHPAARSAHHDERIRRRVF